MVVLFLVPIQFFVYGRSNQLKISFSKLAFQIAKFVLDCNCDRVLDVTATCLLYCLWNLYRSRFLPKSQHAQNDSPKQPVESETNPLVVFPTSPEEQFVSSNAVWLEI